MKNFVLFLIFFFYFPFLSIAQTYTDSDSSLIISLNQQIDNLVVLNNIETLDKLYADDFVFSHGSGRIEGKQGWFTSVAKGNFINRQHDSVTVELHLGIAIVRGKLSVLKKNVTINNRYALKYLRVYALRNKQWQLISHITVSELHEP